MNAKQQNALHVAAQEKRDADRVYATICKQARVTELAERERIAASDMPEAEKQTALKASFDAWTHAVVSGGIDYDRRTWDYTELIALSLKIEPHNFRKFKL